MGFTLNWKLVRKTNDIEENNIGNIFDHYKECPSICVSRNAVSSQKILCAFEEGLNVIDFEKLQKKLIEYTKGIKKRYNLKFRN